MPPPLGSKYAAFIHSSWLVTAKPESRLRVAARLLIVYMPVSVCFDRRTVYVVCVSWAPATVLIVFIFFDRILPFCSALMKRAERVKSAKLNGFCAQAGEATE